jgi:L-alanine-DL-glutamate epimerase-like enolase superfamily enzyme
MGAAPTAFAGMSLTSVDSLFVRVCTDAGVDGWGEGWGHVACHGDLEASPYHDAVRARQGRLSVPPGPGLGLDPDMEVLNRYRLGPPVVIES